MDTDVIMAIASIVGGVIAGVTGIIAAMSKFAKLFMSSNREIVQSYRENSEQDRSIIKAMIDDFSKVANKINDIETISIDNHQRITDLNQSVQSIDSKVSEIANKQNDHAHTIMGLLEDKKGPCHD